MNIKFNCPHCSRPLGATGDMAGQENICPKCKRTLQVPIPAPLPVAITPEKSPPPRNAIAGKRINWKLSYYICVPLAIATVTIAVVCFWAPSEHFATPKLSYEILSKGRGREGIPDCIGMEILVNANASKQDVMELAHYFLQKYPNKLTLIDILDSREAWRHREDETDAAYSDKEFFKHWLVQIVDGKIYWEAKGRDD